MIRIRVASKKQEPRYLSRYFDLKASNKGPPCSLNMYVSHSRNLESEVKFSKTPTHVLLQLGHPKHYIDSYIPKQLLNRSKHLKIQSLNPRLVTVQYRMQKQSRERRRRITWRSRCRRSVDAVKRRGSEGVAP